MRVATNTLPGMLVQQMHQLGNRQNRLQSQAATGQRVEWGDDDPAAMRKAMELRTASGANSQYGRNIETLQSRLTTSLGAIRTLQDVADRAGEIAINADGLSSTQELDAYASELDQLIRQAVQTANTKHGQDSLFGGTRTDRPPFVLQQDADGKITGVTYQGNGDVAELEIAPGSRVGDRIPGASTGATGRPGLVTDAGSGADLFGHLIALRDHLRAGDTAAIAGTDVAALQKDEENLMNRLAESGALQARLEAAGTSVDQQSTRLEEAFTNVAGADFSATMIELGSTRLAYQAAMQSGAQLLRTSLMDYLR